MSGHPLNPNTEKLSKVLEALPSSDDFIEYIKQNPPKDGNYIVPYLRELHEVVYEILPKPNKGLWEPGLNLDRFLLSYYALAYKNHEIQQKVESNQTISKTEANSPPQDSENNEEMPILRSKL
ncbi:lolB [Acrasis kona]|uniref:LolB n=1 Tax=Acrasis kona TaxID=1008807 RepID=A0AAW2ZPE4_9EUKA